MDVILAGRAGRLHQALALGDLDLGLHDVDAGDFLGHRMLDLHAGVHLDEVELACVHIHQEFDGAGAFVIDLFGDLLAEATYTLALGAREVRGRGAFHDLLVPTLDRAIALPKVIDVALAVAEDLNLDVAGALYHLFQIALTIAESGFRLATAFEHLLFQFLGLEDGAHAATTSAPGGFQHHWVPDFIGLLADQLHIVAEDFGGGDDWNTRLNGDLAGRGFVAEGVHGVGLGPDEGDAVSGTGIDEIRVFRQQTIARVNGIGPAFARDPDDFLNREIGRDRAKALTDPIGLVRLEAVQRKLVFFGVDGDGTFAQLVRGPHHADSDLTPVGNKDFLEFGHRAVPVFRSCSIC